MLKRYEHEELFEEVEDYLLEENNYMIITIVNDLNCYYGYFKYLQAYCMEDFNELMEGLSPIELANMISMSCFNSNCDYFRVNEDNSIETFYDDEYKVELHDYVEEITYTFLEAYFVEDNKEAFYINEELQSILDKYEKEFLK